MENFTVINNSHFDGGATIFYFDNYYRTIINLLVENNNFTLGSSINTGLSWTVQYYSFTIRSSYFDSTSLGFVSLNGGRCYFRNFLIEKNFIRGGIIQSRTTLTMDDLVVRGNQLIESPGLF
jgi:hypothetical protein